MATKHRSPNYPSVGLSDALEFARQLYEKERAGSTSEAVACQHWGYKSPKSGGALITAALRAYGLIETAGAGAKRTVKITDRARRLILGSPDDEGLKQEAVLTPKIHREIWDRWPDGLPSEETIRHYLVFDRNFNENAVDGFIENYLKSLRFAGLGDSASVGHENEDRPGSLGRGFTQTIDMGQVSPESVAHARLSQGEQEFLRGKLPGGRHFRLLVSGSTRPQDIGKVIRLLEVQAELLEDDDTPPDGPE